MSKLQNRLNNWQIKRLRLVCKLNNLLSLEAERQKTHAAGNPPHCLPVAAGEGGPGQHGVLLLPLLRQHPVQRHRPLGHEQGVAEVGGSPPLPRSSWSPSSRQPPGRQVTPWTRDGPAAAAPPGTAPGSPIPSPWPLCAPSPSHRAGGRWVEMMPNGQVGFGPWHVPLLRAPGWCSRLIRDPAAEVNKKK